MRSGVSCVASLSLKMLRYYLYEKSIKNNQRNSRRESFLVASTTYRYGHAHDEPAAAAAAAAPVRHSTITRYRDIESLSSIPLPCLGPPPPSPFPLPLRSIRPLIHIADMARMRAYSIVIITIRDAHCCTAARTSLSSPIYFPCTFTFHTFISGL